MGKQNKGDTARSKGDRLSDETLNYYKRVAETLEEGFSATEDKEIFLNNVFSQLENEAVSVCRHIKTSHVVESLLTDASCANVLTIFTTFTEAFPILCNDRFGSQVLQKVVGLIPRFVQPETDSPSGDAEEKELLQCFTGLCQWLEDNLNDSLTHVYASHVLRVVFEVLGGKEVGENVVRSRYSRTQQRDKRPVVCWFQPPVEYKKIFKKMAKKIFQHDEFTDLLVDPLANPVIQTVLLSLHLCDQKNCQKYIRKVIKKSGLVIEVEGEDKKSSLPALLQDEVGSFMVEQLIKLGSETVYEEIYQKIFKGRLLKVAIHPVANFILQRLISHVKVIEQFEEMFAEICPYLEDVMALNHLGIITHLAETCYRMGCKQEKLLKSLMAAFHCAEPVERQAKLVPLLASLTTYEVFYNIEDNEDVADDGQKKEQKKEDTPEKPILDKINYHGSMLLQHLLRFGNPKPVISSLVQLSPEEFKNLSCDPSGSHVIDAFCQSSSIGEKSRDLLINKMKSQMVNIACNKNGSRSLEAMWKQATLSQKTTIANALSKAADKLRSDRFGFFIHRNFGIYHFTFRRKDWIEAHTTSIKKRKLFQDILDDSHTPRKKQKDATSHQAEMADNASLLLEETDEILLGNPLTRSHIPVETEDSGSRSQVQLPETSTHDRKDKKWKKTQKSQSDKEKTGGKIKSKEHKIKDKGMIGMLNDMQKHKKKR